MFSASGFRLYIIDSLAVDGWNLLWLITFWIPVFGMFPVDVWFIILNSQWSGYTAADMITGITYLTPLYYVLEPIARYVLHLPLEGKWDLA